MIKIVCRTCGCQSKAYSSVEEARDDGWHDISRPQIFGSNCIYFEGECQGTDPEDE